MIFLSIFKNTRLLGNATVFLLILGLYLPSLIEILGAAEPVAGVPHSDMPFYNVLFGAIHKVPALSHLVAMLVMLVISYLLIRIGTRDQLVQQHSLMPAMFYILFTAALPDARPVSPAMIGSLFFLLSFNILFEVREKEPNTYSIFAASLILVLGSMFYLKLIWFVPLIWLSLWTLRQVTWRELFYPISGYLLLVLFLFTWYWGVKDNGSEMLSVISENISFSGKFHTSHLSVYLFYGFVMFLVVIASIYMLGRFQTLKTDIQKLFQVLFYMFLGGGLFFLLVARFNPAALAFVAFPVSFVLSFYFHRRRNPWIHEVLIWILLGLVVYVQLMV